MEREGAGPPWHDLIGDALARAMRAQETSRITLEAVHDSAVELAQTVESSRHSRQERAIRPRHPLHPPKGRTETDRSMP